MQADIYEGKEVTPGELHEILNTMDEHTVLVVMFSEQKKSDLPEERQCDVRCSMTCRVGTM